MQFTYTLQYRDQLEAAQARFPGDAPAPRPRPTAALLLAALLLAAGIYVLLSRMPAASRATVPAVAAEGAEVSSDPMENPVFGTGAIIAALGGAVYLVPLAYVLGMRRSARPMHDGPVTAGLDEQGVSMRSGSKDFSLAWDGVVAVSESPRLFVLKTVSDLRLVLPKRAMEEAADVEALRAVLRQNVPPLAGVAAP